VLSVDVTVESDDTPGEPAVVARWLFLARPS
jgi:hypothetical protein